MNNPASSKEAERKATIKKELDEAFGKNLALKYENDCKRNDVAPSLEGLVKYAIEHGVVRDIDICRYMTFEMYPKALYESNGRRRAAVYYLEDIIPVSDRTILIWIKHLSARHLHYRRGHHRRDKKK